MKFLQIFLIILLISSCASKELKADERIKSPFLERDPTVPRKELPCEKYGYRDPKLKKEEEAPWFDPSRDRVCKIKGKKCYARFVDSKDEMVCNSVLLDFLEKFKKAVAKNDPKEVAKFFDFSSPERPCFRFFKKDEFIKKDYFRIFDKNMRYAISGIDLDYIYQLDNNFFMPIIFLSTGSIYISSEPKIIFISESLIKKNIDENLVSSVKQAMERKIKRLSK